MRRRRGNLPYDHALPVDRRRCVAVMVVGARGPAPVRPAMRDGVAGQGARERADTRANKRAVRRLAARNRADGRAHQAAPNRAPLDGGVGAPNARRYETEYR